MKRHVVVRWVAYISFILIQAPIFIIRLYVRYDRHVASVNIDQNIYLIDFIFRVMFFIFEMVLLVQFFWLFRFFTFRKLQAAEDTNGSSQMTPLIKIIIALVFVAGLLNLE